MFRSPPAVRGARIAALLCGGLPGLFVVRGAAAQTALTLPAAYHADWRDVAQVSTAGVLYALPYLLKLPSGSPPCAPCDPATVWNLDRVGIRSQSATAGTASSILLVAEGGLAFGGALDGAQGPALRGRLAVLADAGMWSVAASGWIKALVHRSRPILYTSGAPAAAGDRDSRMSFPSGHATVGFAMAAAYLEMAKRDHAPHVTRNAILLFGTATVVSALRVAAGRHFPTDVLAGALLGTGVGFVVARLHH